LTLLEMTDAYCTMADYGVRHDPILVLEVRDAAGNILENNEPVGERVVDSASAYIVISMMETVMNGGTGTRARTMYGFTRPAAGKTGRQSSVCGHHGGIRITVTGNIMPPGVIG
jgi:penicillin-binding protein 1A